MKKNDIERLWTPAHIRAVGVAVGSMLAATATLIVTIKGAWC